MLDIFQEMSEMPRLLAGERPQVGPPQVTCAPCGHKLSVVIPRDATKKELRPQEHVLSARLFSSELPPFRSTSAHGHAILADLLWFNTAFKHNPSRYPSIPLINQFSLSVMSPSFRQKVYKYDSCMSNLLAVLRANDNIRYRSNGKTRTCLKKEDIVENFAAISPSCESVYAFPPRTYQDEVTKFNADVWLAFWNARNKIDSYIPKTPAKSPSAARKRILLDCFVQGMLTLKVNVFRFWIITLGYNISAIEVHTCALTGQMLFGLFADCAFCSHSNQVGVGKVITQNEEAPRFQFHATLMCRCRLPDILVVLLSKKVYPPLDIPSIVEMPYAWQHVLMNGPISTKCDTALMLLLSMSTKERFADAIRRGHPGNVVPHREERWYHEIRLCGDRRMFMGLWAYKYVGVKEWVDPGNLCGTPLLNNCENALVIDNDFPKHMIQAAGVFKLNEHLLHTETVESETRNTYSVLSSMFLCPNLRGKHQDLTFYFLAMIVQMAHTEYSVKAPIVKKDPRRSSRIIETTAFATTLRTGPFGTSEPMSTKPKYVGQAAKGVDFVDFWHCQRSPNACLAYQLAIIDQISQIYLLDDSHAETVTRGWLTVYDDDDDFDKGSPPTHPLVGDMGKCGSGWRQLACKIHRHAVDLKKKLAAEIDARTRDIPNNHENMFICKFCCTETAVYMCDPCRHVASCRNCYAQPRVEEMTACPICRGFVKGLIRIFP